MAKLSLVIPTTGELNKIAEPKVDTAFSTIQTWANGEIEGENNIKAEGVKESNLTAAVQALLNTKSFAALTVKKVNEATFTAATGEMVVMEKNASTLTLPAATANRIVGIWCAPNTITVKAPVANTIFGGFINGATTVSMTLHQHIILQADGTNWLIVAGEPYGGTPSWGRVSSAAAIVDEGSADWTVAKESTGAYSVKWAFTRPSANFVTVATLNSTTAGQVTVSGPTTSLVIVRTYSAAGVAEDREFAFHVLAR